MLVISKSLYKHESSETLHSVVELVLVQRIASAAHHKVRPVSMFHTETVSVVLNYSKTVFECARVHTGV